VGVGEGTAVGNGGSGVSVSVGAGGTVFVAVGGRVEVTVGVNVAAGGAVLVGTGGKGVFVGGGGKGVFVGGGAVGTVCALAVPTQPGALAARITTPRTNPAATMIRGDSVLRMCVIFASLQRSNPGPQDSCPGLSRLRGSGPVD
jgi:hypothetical protein